LSKPITSEPLAEQAASHNAAVIKCNKQTDFRCDALSGRQHQKMIKFISEIKRGFHRYLPLLALSK
jgi:hypothetical protein